MNEKQTKENLPQKEQGERFMRLYVTHERRLFGLVLSLLPVWSDADDVMQETAAVLWRRFDDFEEGTNFSAWAFKVARLQVLDFYKKQRRRQALLSDETFQKLSEQSIKRESHVDDRHLALEKCLGKLKERDQELIQRRYQPNVTTRDVAEEVERSVDAIYKALNRIHTQLLSCIQMQIKSQEIV
ncbi:hypothetical protein MNBD_PLANCTO02-3027 [hydrothermal vent metagenome]|uniref:RNA polymerase sigma-70 region 2 domain-containing protein n=1 Tax=hydrothermal vent metagenome TaxID=652676 RepID=A0A3B1E6U3_9ZZZZ